MDVADLVYADAIKTRLLVLPRSHFAELFRVHSRQSSFAVLSLVPVVSRGRPSLLRAVATIHSGPLTKHADHK